MYKQETIRDQYQQVEEFLADIDINHLQHYLYSQEKPVYFTIFEGKIKTCDSLAKATKYSLKTNLWENFKLRFFQTFIAREIMSTFGLSGFLSTTFLGILLILTVGSEVSSTIDKITSAIHNFLINPYIGFPLLLILVMIGIWEIVRGDDYEVEISLTTPERIKLLELRNIFMKLSAINLNPIIQFITDFDDQTLKINLSVAKK